MLLVTGASGFLGSTIANMAAERGIPVRGLVRRNSDRSRLSHANISLAEGDMADASSLAAALRGVEAVIHCAATTSASAPDMELSRRINVEGTRALVDECRKSGVRRYVQISSQSALPHNRSAYGSTKYLADEIVRGSQLDWTILKPGLIYGSGKAGVFSKVVEFTVKFPVVPVLGSGKHLQSPVHVEDVAWAALECLTSPSTLHREYDLGGRNSMTFDEMIQSILSAGNKRKPLLHLPLPLCMALARTLEMVMKNPPVTTDNVRGVKVAQPIDNSAAQRDFGYAPRDFNQWVMQNLGNHA